MKIGPKRKYRIVPINWSVYKDWKIQVAHRRFLFVYSDWSDIYDARYLTREEADAALKLFEERP